MNDSQRLTHLLKFLKMSAASLAKSIGHKTPQRLYQVINGRNGISDRLANEIVSVFSFVSFLWLVKGEGEMFSGSSEYAIINDRLFRLMEVLSITPQTLADKSKIPLDDISSYLSDRVVPPKDVVGKILKAFPQINPAWLIDGDGAFFSDGSMVEDKLSTYVGLKYFIEDVSLIKKELQSLDSGSDIYSLLKNFDYAITIYGRCMEPMFKGGEIIFCRKVQNEAIIYGDVYFVETKDAKLLRYLFKGKSDDSLCLRCENHHYPDEEIPLIHINGIYIVLGKFTRI